MFKRQRAGSVVCASCGYLVGVNDATCYHCGRRNPGLWGFAPALRDLGRDMGFVPFVTGLCVVMYVLSLVSSGPSALGVRGSLFNILPPSACSLLRYGASGAVPVFALDRWWTVLSAAWLHGSLLHIGLNLYWIWQIAPAVAELYGPGRMVIIYTAGAILGFAASSFAGMYLDFLPHFLQGAGLTIGASAPFFGLLGALYHYGNRGGSAAIRQQALYYAVVMFVFGLIGSGVDNYAHAGGFLGGWLAAKILDPLRPERIDHLVAALACLALSVVSLVASVLVPVGLRGCP
jgi:rhomboid protease GluP